MDVGGADVPRALLNGAGDVVDELVHEYERGLVGEEAGVPSSAGVGESVIVFAYLGEGVGAAESVGDEAGDGFGADAGVVEVDAAQGVAVSAVEADDADAVDGEVGGDEVLRGGASYEVRVARGGGERDQVCGFCRRRTRTRSDRRRAARRRRRFLSRSNAMRQASRIAPGGVCGGEEVGGSAFCGDFVRERLVEVGGVLLGVAELGTRRAGLERGRERHLGHLGKGSVGCLVVGRRGADCRLWYHV